MDADRERVERTDDDRLADEGTSDDSCARRVAAHRRHRRARPETLTPSPPENRAALKAMRSAVRSAERTPEEIALIWQR